MAKFLNTSAITYYLDQLIGGSRRELYIISPYLKFNDKIRELLQDTESLDRVEIIYGKKNLAKPEADWLAEQLHIDCRFCKNLHAKCYLSEVGGIITSMNLYDFSQVNNNEMGILFTKKKDPGIYEDALKEAQRLSRISVSDSASTASPAEQPATSPAVRVAESKTSSGPNKASISLIDEFVEPIIEERPISTTKLAQRRNISAKQMFDQLSSTGYIVKMEQGWELTDKGRNAGGKMKKSKRFGDYIVWPVDLVVGS